jgi:hypothetical protein
MTKLNQKLKDNVTFDVMLRDDAATRTAARVKICASKTLMLADFHALG